MPGKPYGVSFRMYRAYFDAIVAGTKVEEFRASKPYWEGVAQRVERRLLARQPVVAVFFCGKENARRRIVRVSHYASPRYALKRAPTEQEVAMVGRGHVIGFHLAPMKPPRIHPPPPVKAWDGKRFRSVPRRYVRWIFVCDSQAHAHLYFSKPSKKVECVDCGLAGELLGPFDVTRWGG